MQNRKQIGICIIALLSLFMISYWIEYFFGTYTKVVHGNSMEPLIKDGSKVTVVKASIFNPVRESKIVCARVNKIEAVKRVIATSNDKLRVSGNQAWVNNKEIDNDFKYSMLEWDDCYLRDVCQVVETKDYVEYTIPKGYLFLAGDSIDSSIDSRFKGFGLVKEKDVECIVVGCE